MEIILDANVIIGGHQGTFDLKAWLASGPKSLFEVAGLTVAELWNRVERALAAHKARPHQYLQTVLAPSPIVVNYQQITANCVV